MADPYKMIDSVLPLEDYEAWQYIKRNLNNLYWFAEQVEAAAQLMDHCEGLAGKALDEREALTVIRWSYIATRDAAISIYNFAQLKHAIHKLTNRSPTIRAHIDLAKKAEAGHSLQQAVPEFGRIRQSVGHAGELFSTPKRQKENAVSRMPGTTVVINGVVSGRRYTGTVEGRFVSYELTEAVASALFASAKAMDESFLPLAAFTRKTYRQRQRSRRQQRHED